MTRTRTRPGSLLLACAAALALAACGSSGGSTSAGSGASLAALEPVADAEAAAADGELTSLTIAEPVHSLGYLPLYAAAAEGYFAEEGLEVTVTTLTGGGHVNGLLSGEVWGFIGGPESAGVANVRGADLVSVANVVDRGNVYFTAPPGVEWDGTDLGGFLRGKTIAGGRFGGTPNAILRYILIDAGLDPDEDVTLIESEDSGAVLSIMQAGQADVAVTSEPLLGQGIEQGIWSEPFLNPLELLGPYAYSVIVVQQETVDDDPETTQAFVAALARGQELVESDPDAAFELAQAEFPTLDPAVIQATLDRAYADSLWNGSVITPEAAETALEVARSGQILDDSAVPVTFETVVDMSFVDQLP